jgi:hypothetical protein
MPLLAVRLAVAAAIVGASFAVGIGDELKTRAEAIAAVKTKGDVIVVLCTTPQVSDTLTIFRNCAAQAAKQLSGQ